MQMLALVEALRAGDHFTAVVLARPFAFEGMRRAAAADRLLASLRSIAHLSVVIDQVGHALPKQSSLKTVHLALYFFVWVFSRPSSYSSGCWHTSFLVVHSRALG